MKRSRDSIGNKIAPARRCLPRPANGDCGSARESGFKSVLIATGDGSGGYCDVEDSGYRWRNAVSVNRGLLRKVIRAEVGGP